jgi:hypothetical protein
MIELTVLGEPASKSNARRLVRVGRKFRIIKSKKALDYLDRLREQVAPLDPLLDGNLEIWMDIFYASRRPDLDELMIVPYVSSMSAALWTKKTRGPRLK